MYYFDYWNSISFVFEMIWNFWSFAWIWLVFVWWIWIACFAPNDVTFLMIKWVTPILREKVVKCPNLEKLGEFIVSRGIGCYESFLNLISRWFEFVYGFLGLNLISWVKFRHVGSFGEFFGAHRTIQRFAKFPISSLIWYFSSIWVL